MRALIVIAATVALFAAACADPSTGGAPGTTEVPNAGRFPVVIDQTGGCFQMGPNCVRYEISADGTLTGYRLGSENPESFGTVTLGAAAVANLAAALAATDLEALAARLGPGTCQACVDGIDTIVTFTVADTAVAFDSATVHFDPAEPMFAALANLQGVAAEALPLPIEPLPTPAGESAQIYGAAVRQIVEVDNSFGGGNPFTTILVVDHVEPDAGDAVVSSVAGRPLTEAEQAAILDALGDLDVQFIADASEYRTDDLMPVIESSAIVAVGEIEEDSADRLVGMSLWCGGLCGIWLTYRVVTDGAGWSVGGIEGPIAIS